jgi:hypothetical protein
MCGNVLYLYKGDHGLPPSLQANARIVSLLGHGHFFPKPFNSLFIIILPLEVTQSGYCERCAINHNKSLTRNVLVLNKK